MNNASLDRELLDRVMLTNTTILCLEKGHLAVFSKLKYSCSKCGGERNIAICTFSKDKTNPSAPVSTADAETSTNFSSNKFLFKQKEHPFANSVSFCLWCRQQEIR